MKNHHSVPRKFPNLTVVKLQPDPTQSDEDPSFIELKVTTQMLNVLNAAKAWARQAARTKKTRAKMSQQERTLFDTVQYLLMSEGRSPLSVPLSEPQKKALELRKQRERLERHVSDIRIRNAAAGR